MECVIYQGYLQKTPPLDRLIVSWKKRWFILSQRDPFDPRSVELTYYTESSLAEKRGTIDMPSITRIHPSPSKAKGHIFSIEVKDKKIMLKAEDAKTKDIWIAKLYEFAGHGMCHNYHVTVPTQPLASYNEGLLQLGRADSQISIITPTSSTPILNVPYSQIRRFGYQVVMENYDVIWFEICNCRAEEQEFCFFVVASGLDRAMLIAGDLKTKIEKDTGRFLIMEDDKHPESTYISRTHYGCPPYPKLGRERVLHAGLVNLEATKMVGSTILTRRLTEPATQQLLNPANERRNTVQNLLGTKTSTSPRHSPTRSPSPARQTSPNPTSNPASQGGTSLQDMVRSNQRGGNVAGLHQRSHRRLHREDTLGLRSGSEVRPRLLGDVRRANKLSNWRNKRPSEGNLRGAKLSLADLKLDRVGSGGSTGSAKEKYFPSRDSGIGTSADLVLDQDGRVANPFHSPSPSPSPYSKGRKLSQPLQTAYDHLGSQKTAKPQTSYDHLPSLGGTPNGGASNRPPVVPPRSGISMGDPYLDFYFMSADLVT